MKNNNVLIALCLLLLVNKNGMADALVQGHVYDQFGLPVSDIKIRDRFDPTVNTVSHGDGSYSVQVNTNMLTAISLAAYADYIDDSTVYGNVAEPTSTKDLNHADIFVVRKPARRGNVELVVPWIISQGAQHNISHSNLVVELRSAENYFEEQQFIGVDSKHVMLTNITFGVEYFLSLAVPSLENAQMSLINGVFIETDVGVTNQFRNLPSCNKQYGVTNVLFSIESKQ